MSLCEVCSLVVLALDVFENHQEASTHSWESAQFKSSLCLPVEELAESAVRYLASAENGLKLAAVVNPAHLPFCYAFFTQFQEARYPLKQGPGCLLQLFFYPWTLPQMSAQHTLLRDTREAQSLRKTLLKHRSCFTLTLILVCNQGWYILFLLKVQSKP